MSRYLIALCLFVVIWAYVTGHIFDMPLAFVFYVIGNVLFGVVWYWNGKKL